LRRNGVSAHRIAVLYPVIDIGENPLPMPRPDRPFTVSVVGRVNGTKGHQEVAREFAVPPLADLDWRLNLYGAPFPGQEPALYEVLESTARDSRVRYRGEVQSFDEIAAETDVLACFPTKPESFGLVPVEGWLAGIRSVGWALGGATEVLTLVGGLSVEFRGPERRSIGDALFSAYSDWVNAHPLPPRSLVQPYFSAEQRLRGVRSLVSLQVPLK
jgi:glycosyltransferase involved in cell wall biosynthesis